jgi:hypothetical protein
MPQVNSSRKRSRHPRVQDAITRDVAIARLRSIARACRPRIYKKCKYNVERLQSAWIGFCRKVGMNTGAHVSSFARTNCRLCTVGSRFISSTRYQAQLSTQDPSVANPKGSYETLCHHASYWTRSLEEAVVSSTA